MLNSTFCSDGPFQRISIKHSGFNRDFVIEASFKVLTAVPDIMNKVQLFQERILTDAEQLALATGAAAYRWEDLTKAPVSPSMLLKPKRYGDGAKDLFITLNCVQETIIRDAYVQFSRLLAYPTGPLFPTTGGRSRELRIRTRNRIDAARMLRRRLAKAAVVGKYSPHSFRATGLTRLLEEGGGLFRFGRLTRPVCKNASLSSLTISAPSIAC